MTVQMTPTIMTYRSDTSRCDDKVVLVRHPSGGFDDLVFIIGDDLDPFELDAEIEAMLGEEVGVCWRSQDIPSVSINTLVEGEGWVMVDGLVVVRHSSALRMNYERKRRTVPRLAVEDLVSNDNHPCGLDVLALAEWVCRRYRRSVKRLCRTICRRQGRSG